MCGRVAAAHVHADEPLLRHIHGAHELAHHLFLLRLAQFVGFGLAENQLAFLLVVRLPRDALALRAAVARDMAFRAPEQLFHRGRRRVVMLCVRCTAKQSRLDQAGEVLLELPAAVARAAHVVHEVRTVAGLVLECIDERGVILLVGRKTIPFDSGFQDRVYLRKICEKILIRLLNKIT